MFSVVIPAFNCEQTICDVLNSVANQTRLDLIDEIIIINDGSSDGTESTIKKYISENPELRIKYVPQENHGVAFTRNKGIKMATSDWIALLDSDDVWFPNKIERQYAVISKNPDILFLGSEYPLPFYFPKQNNGLYKLTPKLLCLKSMPVTPSVVFHRETGIALGLYEEEMSYCEDINFFQKFFLKDSYYILGENLVKIGIGKKFYGEIGLSSNIKKMDQGRTKNVKDLYKMGLISKYFMILILFVNKIKFIRRKLLISINRIIYKGANKNTAEENGTSKSKHYN